MQSQLLLIRLDILDAFLVEFDRMRLALLFSFKPLISFIVFLLWGRDLCRLDMRRESKASTSLHQIKKSVVQASLSTVVNLISVNLIFHFIICTLHCAGSINLKYHYTQAPAAMPVNGLCQAEARWHW